MKLASLYALLFAALASLREPAPTKGEWKRIEPGYVPAWPRDHGVHEEYRTEWWYATGEVEGANGAHFGVQLTIFRQGTDPTPLAEGESPLRVKHAYAGHFVVVDLESGKLLVAERARRTTPGLARASVETLDVALEGWTMRFDGSELRLVADDRERGIAIDLALKPDKSLVMHGKDGISRKGDGAGLASAYMSWTRMSARGSLACDGARHDVKGSFWFDHEWGTTQLGAGVVGWDWFGLRLDDGRELMLYRLRHADGSVEAASSATLVEKDGTSETIAVAELDCAPISTWKSPRSGAVYPSRWRVHSPERGLDLTIAAKVEDCELDARDSTGVVYWEGPVEVTGSVHGAGYGEFTGYAGSLARRF